jgi:hypothetical protein
MRYSTKTPGNPGVFDVFQGRTMRVPTRSLDAGCRGTVTSDSMVAVSGLLFVLVGIPALVYLSERRRNRRTQAELNDAAVRAAKGVDEGPGSREPVNLTRPSGPLLPPPY